MAVTVEKALELIYTNIKQKPVYRTQAGSGSAGRPLRSMGITYFQAGCSAGATVGRLFIGYCIIGLNLLNGLLMVGPGADCTLEKVNSPSSRIPGHEKPEPEINGVREQVQLALDRLKR